MTLNLTQTAPADLLDPEKAPLAELLAAAARLDGWSERAAEVLDFVYVNHFLRLVCGRHTGREVSALAEHVERVLGLHERADLDALRRPYGTRWSAYVHLLDARLEMLESQDHDEALGRKHVREILTLVGRERILSQDALAERLDLKKANLARILKFLEAVELVERRKKGWRNEVRLGVNAPAEFSDPPPEQQPAPRSTVPRGSKIFSA